VGRDGGGGEPSSPIPADEIGSAQESKRWRGTFAEGLQRGDTRSMVPEPRIRTEGAWAFNC